MHANHIVVIFHFIIASSASLAAIDPFFTMFAVWSTQVEVENA